MIFVPPENIDEMYLSASAMRKQVGLRWRGETIEPVGDVSLEEARGTNGRIKGFIGEGEHWLGLAFDEEVTFSDAGLVEAGLTAKLLEAVTVSAARFFSASKNASMTASSSSNRSSASS